jgi:hypothetical protein
MYNIIFLITFYWRNNHKNIQASKSNWIIYKNKIIYIYIYISDVLEYFFPGGKVKYFNHHEFQIYLFYKIITLVIINFIVIDTIDILVDRQINYINKTRKYFWSVICIKMLDNTLF